MADTEPRSALDPIAIGVSILTIIQVIGPLIVNLRFPKVSPIMGRVLDAIIHAQAIPGANTGVEKKAHVMSIAEDALDSLIDIYPHIDRADTLAAVSLAVDTIVATAKVIAGLKIAVTPPPEPAHV